MNIKNMALLTLVIIITISVSLLMGCDPVMEAKEGTIIVCKTCKATIADNTRTIKTVRSEIENFRVKTEEKICENCVNKEMCDELSVARGFFNALMDRDIEKAITYCDASVEDSYGTFNLPRIAYEPRDFCSRLSARMDNNWIMGNISHNPEVERNGSYFIIANKNGYDVGQYIEGKKIIAQGFSFGMHKLTNGQFKIYHLIDYGCLVEGY